MQKGTTKHELMSQFSRFNDGFVVDADIAFFCSALMASAHLSFF
ncbi:hypothetical protein sync_1488 [Synechococcus sp. CC9311]|nr:hypothetical protein sync_1488 [Synechococcus sp. CC9311]